MGQSGTGGASITVNVGDSMADKPAPGTSVVPGSSITIFWNGVAIYTTTANSQGYWEVDGTISANQAGTTNTAYIDITPPGVQHSIRCNHDNSELSRTYCNRNGSGGSSCTLSVSLRRSNPRDVWQCSRLWIRRITDSLGNSHSEVALASGVRSVAIYMATASSTGTDTITAGGSGTAYDLMVCYAVSGASTSGYLTSTLTGGSYVSGSVGPPTSVNSFTPATGSVVVSFEINDGGAASSPTSGFALTSGTATDGYNVAAEYDAGWGGGSTTTPISLSSGAPYWSAASIALP